MGASNKGPLDERVKTDIRISERVMRHIEDAIHPLGIPKNTFFTLASCDYVVKLAPLVKGTKKREKMILDIERLFQKTLKEIREAA